MTWMTLWRISILDGYGFKLIKQILKFRKNWNDQLKLHDEYTIRYFWNNDNRIYKTVRHVRVRWELPGNGFTTTDGESVSKRVGLKSCGIIFVFHEFFEKQFGYSIGINFPSQKFSFNIILLNVIRARAIWSYALKIINWVIKQMHSPKRK